MLTHVFRAALPFALRSEVSRYRRIRRGKKLRFATIGGYSLQAFDDHACIFVHVPKTAGTITSIALFGNRGGGHLTASDYKAIFGEATFARYFKFAFVRNPWARAVAAFLFLKSRTRAVASVAGYGDFGSFVEGWMNPRSVGTSIHFMPQHEFVCTRDMGLAVDFLGRFESLPTSFEIIKQRLGIDAELEPNTSSMKRLIDFDSYYTRKTRSIVREAYQRDIETFGYEYRVKALS